MKVEQKCGIISRTMLNDAAISLTLEVGDMVRTAFRAPGAVRPHQVRTFPAAPSAHLRLRLSGGEGTPPTG